MKAFLVWLGAHPRHLFNWTLVLVGLSLLPAVNFYYGLSENDYHPIVRAVDYVLPESSDYPVNISKTPAPNLSARSAIVVDASSKTIMMAKNPDLKLLPASTTKIMTALVVLESYDLDLELTVSRSVVGQVMGLELGEKITVTNLLQGMLVASANDAAQVLADNYPGGQSDFVAEMNIKAQNLGLKDTHFVNPIGLDQLNHFTTVHDLSLLAAAGMSHPLFAQIVNTRQTTVTDVDQEVVHELETINELLGNVEGLVGVKTGWTELAGECLVTYVKRGDRAIITVVLGSNDRFGESKTLIDWAFANFKWEGAPTQ